MCAEIGTLSPAPFPLYSYAFGRRGASPRMLTKPLCRAWPRRPEFLCLPAKPCPYSLNALHQVCARDAQTKSDLGVAPAVYYPPLQQNSVGLGQLPDQGATSAVHHVFKFPLNA